MRSAHESTDAPARPLTEMGWRNAKGAFLVLTIALTWSSPAPGQIAVDGSYWKYNGRLVLLLGGWNHGHNPFIDHNTDNDRDKQGVSTPALIRKAMDESPPNNLSFLGNNALRFLEMSCHCFDSTDPDFAQFEQ